jgi:hypothetical protein
VWLASEYKGKWVWRIANNACVPHTLHYCLILWRVIICLFSDDLSTVLVTYLWIRPVVSNISWTRTNSGKIKIFTGHILNDNKNILFTTLLYWVPWKSVCSYNLDHLLHWTEECQWENWHCFLATKVSISGHIWEVATRRPLSNLPSSSQFLHVFFTIFIFEKNCSQRYVRGWVKWKP